MTRVDAEQTPQELAIRIAEARRLHREFMEKSDGDRSAALYEGLAKVIVTQDTVLGILHSLTSDNAYTGKDVASRLHTLERSSETIKAQLKLLQESSSYKPPKWIITIATVGGTVVGVAASTIIAFIAFFDKIMDAIARWHS